MLECAQVPKFSQHSIFFQLGCSEPKSPPVLQIARLILLSSALIVSDVLAGHILRTIYAYTNSPAERTLSPARIPLKHLCLFPRFLRRPLRRSWEISTSHLHSFQADKICLTDFFPLPEVTVPPQANLCLRFSPGSDSSSERKAF